LQYELDQGSQNEEPEENKSFTDLKDEVP